MGHADPAWGGGAYAYIWQRLVQDLAGVVGRFLVSLWCSSDHYACNLVIILSLLLCRASGGLLLPTCELLALVLGQRKMRKADAGAEIAHPLESEPDPELWLVEGA